MSSHREAPEISKDPSADNTDVYAFVSPDNPDTVTLIANFLPFELPYGGPNFNEFADDVLYEIKISNARARASRHHLPVPVQHRDPQSQHVPLQHRADLLADRPELEPSADLLADRGSIRDHDGQTSRTCSATDLTCPPVNVGVHSTPNYPALAAKTYHGLGGNRMVFAGQRADGFHVDLGSIFDLGDLRPFQGAYNQRHPADPGEHARRQRPARPQRAHASPCRCRSAT